MSTPDFPSNRKMQAPPVQQEKRVERVTTSQAHRRKKPMGRRLAENLGGGDVRGVWATVMFDLLFPNAKIMFVEAFNQGVERMFLGDMRSGAARTTGRIIGGGLAPRDYRAPFAAAHASRPAIDNRRGRSSHDIGEIILDTRQEAEIVIGRMDALIQQYDHITVADLYQMVGITPNPIDARWGWVDISDASFSRLREGGYVLNLSRPDHLG